MANMKSKDLNNSRKSSSMLRNDNNTSGTINNRFRVRSNSKKKHRLVKNSRVHGSINQNTQGKFTTMRSKKLLQSVSDSKFHTRTGMNNAAKIIGKKAPMAIIEQNIEKAKTKVANVAKKRDKANRTEDEYEKLVILTEESNILHHELKTLNESLNIFIEEMKNFKERTSKKRQVDPAEEDERKRRVKQQEIHNYDKLTKNLIKEHEKLSRRLELVSNPQYVFDLREKVEEMKNYVRDLKNNQRKLEKNQKNRDKKLNYMINRGGEVGHMRKINDTHNELAVTRTQMGKVNYKLEKLEEAKIHNQEQISALTDKLSKLQTVAQKHDIDIDQVAKDVERKNDFEDFSEIKKELMHKKAIMENAIKVQKKKYQQTFSKEKKRYEQLIKEKQEMTVMLDQREKDSQLKKKVIIDLKIKYDKFKANTDYNNFMENESEQPQSKVDNSPNKHNSKHKDVSEKKEQLKEESSKKSSHEGSDHSEHRKGSHDESNHSDNNKKNLKQDKQRSSSEDDKDSSKNSNTPDKREMNNDISSNDKSK